MSATNSRIATLRRALRIIEDEYEAHKGNWHGWEVNHLETIKTGLVKLIAQEKLRLAA